MAVFKCASGGLVNLIPWHRHTDSKHNDEWSSRQLNRKFETRGIIELMVEQIWLDLDREILNDLLSSRGF